MKQLFSIGFKPLFLCTALSALLLMGVWIAYLNGLLLEFQPRPNPIWWHGHEMLFGFTGAAIGGFLFTAVATWTNRPPISGFTLGLVTALWVSGRVAMIYSGSLPETLSGAAVVIDACYWVSLAILVGREVLLSQNHRNLPIVLILAGFASLSVLFHFQPDTALRGMIALICVLITLIGGRIIPAFTTNWLKKTQGEATTTPVSFSSYDKLVALITVPTFASWCFVPSAPFIGWLLIITSVLHLIRLGRWQGHRTFAEPLIFSLHIAYCWIPLGIFLIGVSAISQNMSVSAGIHALGIGAIASMIMAVAMRAARGHSGLSLTSSPALSFCFVLIHLTVLLRVSSQLYAPLLTMSAITWIAAFSVFGFLLIQVIFIQPHKGES